MGLTSYWSNSSRQEWDIAEYGRPGEARVEFMCEYLTNEEVDATSTRWEINNIARIIRTTNKEINFQKNDNVYIDSVKYLIDRTYTEEKRPSPIVKSKDIYTYILLRY